VKSQCFGGDRLILILEEGIQEFQDPKFDHHPKIVAQGHVLQGFKQRFSDSRIISGGQLLKSFSHHRVPEEILQNLWMGLR